MSRLVLAGLAITDGCHRDGRLTRRARGKGYIEQGFEGLAERSMLWTNRLCLAEGSGLLSRRLCRNDKWWLVYGKGGGIGEWL